MFNYSSSDSSGNDVTLAATQRFVGGKSNMEVHLDNHFTNRIYTSSSPISGHVKLEIGKDTRFDTVQILFLGTSRTQMDGLRHPHSTSHTFLKLEMPIPESSYPVPRIYEAGSTYEIPFNFIVPTHLTINACNHNVDSAAVQDSHLSLPPSIGEWSGKDDFAPLMARVEYNVIARVLSEENENGKRMKILEATHPVRVLPAHSELPPLDITPRDRLYKMSKTKVLRKSLLTGKIGSLHVSAKQPGAVMLSPDGASASKSSAQIDFTFEPASGIALPPTVTAVSSKLTAVTYYCTGAINGFPNMGDWVRAFGADARGSYPSTTTLSSTHIDKLRWRQNVGTDSRRGSAWSYATTDTSDTTDTTDTTGTTSETERPGQGSGNSSSPIYHTASLQVPIELPVHKKMFVPSFHSCIVSRAYVLWISVSVSCGNSNTSIMLGLPLQIGVQSADGVGESHGLPSFEAAVEEAAADEHLRPRVMSIPDIQFENHILPGYADLMAGRMVAAN